MANKTIHELTEVTAPNMSKSHELAVYNVTNNTTGRVTVENLFGVDEFLTADDDDEPTGEVDFTSEDDELSPTSTESVDLLTGNDSWSQRFYKVSQMFKNIRYILGKLGTTDISSVGNGTVTGAIGELKNDSPQSGYGAISSATQTETSINITFPKAFSRAPRVVVCFYNASYNRRIHVSNITTSGFTVVGALLSGTASAAIEFLWIAVLPPN